MALCTKNNTRSMGFGSAVDYNDRD